MLIPEILCHVLCWSPVIKRITLHSKIMQYRYHSHGFQCHPHIWYHTRYWLCIYIYIYIVYVKYTHIISHIIYQSYPPRYCLTYIYIIYIYIIQIDIYIYTYIHTYIYWLKEFVGTWGTPVSSGQDRLREQNVTSLCTVTLMWGLDGAPHKRLGGISRGLSCCIV